jgi:hypothetical protein
MCMHVEDHVDSSKVITLEELSSSPSSSSSSSDSFLPDGCRHCVTAAGTALDACLCCGLCVDCGGVLSKKSSDESRSSWRDMSDPGVALERTSERVGERHLSNAMGRVCGQFELLCLASAAAA